MKKDPLPSHFEQNSVQVTNFGAKGTHSATIQGGPKDRTLSLRGSSANIENAETLAMGSGEGPCSPAYFRQNVAGVPRNVSHSSVSPN